jgi:hypothetical protein
MSSDILVCPATERVFAITRSKDSIAKNVRVLQFVLMNVDAIAVLIVHQQLVTFAKGFTVKTMSKYTQCHINTCQVVLSSQTKKKS